MTQPINIFISYRSLDSSKVDVICVRLRSLKNPDGTPRYRIWQDKHDIIEGSDWWQSIMDAIERCDAVIFMMSHEAVKSEVCKTELRHAGACNRPILPLVLQGEYEYRTGGRNVAYLADVPDVILARKLHFLFHEGESFVELVERAVNGFMGDSQRWRFTKPLYRPLDPNATTKQSNDVIAVYDEACDYALRMEFERAVQLFQRVIQLNDSELSDDAHGWTGLLSDYRKLMEFYARTSTRHRAEARWPEYVKSFPRPFTKAVFDPKNLAGLIAGDKPPDEGLPPPPPDPLQAALARAREFSKTGQRNKDWTLFPVVFNTLKVPDMLFCLVPTGTFQMGSNDGKWKDEEPVHAQTFTQPFYIAQTQVTNVQWALGVKAGVVKEPTNPDGRALKWYKDPKMANMPVVGVSWFECQKFAQWAGCRLPTEREWEYSARGIESLRYPWGNDWDATKLVWSENSGDQPNAVNSKPEGVSWVGAYHLSGNVWEWTGSLYEPYAYVADGTRERDTGDRTDVQRVLRGGSWYYLDDSLRAADRFNDAPDNDSLSIGFRCALS